MCVIVDLYLRSFVQFLRTTLCHYYLLLFVIFLCSLIFLLCLFSCFVFLFSIFCIPCLCTVLRKSLSLCTAVRLLFTRKSTDRCHRVTANLRHTNIAPLLSDLRHLNRCQKKKNLSNPEATCAIMLMLLFYGEWLSGLREELLLNCWLLSKEKF